jgi:hypothetical protein
MAKSLAATPVAAFKKEKATIPGSSSAVREVRAQAAGWRWFGGGGGGEVLAPHHPPKKTPRRAPKAHHSFAAARARYSCFRRPSSPPSVSLLFFVGVCALAVAG